MTCLMNKLLEIPVVPKKEKRTFGSSGMVARCKRMTNYK